MVYLNIILYWLHIILTFLITSANVILRIFFSFYFYTGLLLFSLSMLWCHFHCLGVQFTLPDPVTEVRAPAFSMLVTCLFARLSSYYNFFDLWIAVTTFSPWASESCHLSADDPVPLYLILFPAIWSPPELWQISFYFLATSSTSLSSLCVPITFLFVCTRQLIWFKIVPFCSSSGVFAFVLYTLERNGFSLLYPGLPILYFTLQ